jgi:hypothetical protein
MQSESGSTVFVGGVGDEDAYKTFAAKEGFLNRTCGQFRNTAYHPLGSESETSFSQFRFTDISPTKTGSGKRAAFSASNRSDDLIFTPATSNGPS